MKATATVFDVPMTWPQIQRGVRQPTKKPNELIHSSMNKFNVLSFFVPTDRIARNMTLLRGRLQTQKNMPRCMFGRFVYSRGRYQSHLLLTGVTFGFSCAIDLSGFQAFCDSLDGATMMDDTAVSLAA